MLLEITYWSSYPKKEDKEAIDKEETEQTSYQVLLRSDTDRVHKRAGDRTDVNDLSDTDTPRLMSSFTVVSICLAPTAGYMLSKLCPVATITNGKIWWTPWW